MILSLQRYAPGLAQIKRISKIITIDVVFFILYCGKIPFVQNLSKYSLRWRLGSTVVKWSSHVCGVAGSNLQAKSNKFCLDESI